METSWFIQTLKYKPYYNVNLIAASVLDRAALFLKIKYHPWSENLLYESYDRTNHSGGVVLHYNQPLTNDKIYKKNKTGKQFKYVFFVA